MSLNSLIENATGGNFAGVVEKAGMYLFEVIEAYDSKMVYPKDKTRHVGLRLKVHSPVVNARQGETEDKANERLTEKGKVTWGRLYLSENSVLHALRLMAHVAGESAVPAKIEEAAYVGLDDKGQKLYNKSYLAAEVPVNCSALLDRFFVGELEPAKGGYLRLNMFNSSDIEEVEQQRRGAPGPRNLYAGEDTATLAFIQRQKEREARKNGTENGTENGTKQKAARRTVLVEEYEEAIMPEDDLPY